jgi:hypothetical protein
MKSAYRTGLLMMVFLALAAASAGAETATIGSITGSGQATFSGGVVTAYSFTGNFNFDNTTLWGGHTLASSFLFNDLGQYRFTVNSSGTVPAYDRNGISIDPAFLKGNFQWVLDNIVLAPPSSTLYGNVVNFVFVPTNQNQTEGTVTGTIKSSDNNIHWDYAYDTDSGPPAGMTSFAAFGWDGNFAIAGLFNVTGGDPTNMEYNLQGTMTANVAEPGVLMLLGTSMIGLAAFGRRTRKRRNAL